jgi:hypothetical protein
VFHLERVNEAEFPFARSLGDSIWLQDRFFEPGTDSSIGIASIRSLPVQVDRFQTANNHNPRIHGGAIDETILPFLANVSYNAVKTKQRLPLRICA